MKLTDPQRRALRILKNHGPMLPRDFAAEMWPTSEGWRRVYNCGPYGATRGSAMWRSGGGFLGKLCRLGLVQHALNSRWNGYLISTKGRETLQVVEAARKAGSSA